MGVEEPVPDRNVYVYNNIVYNPAPFQSAWEQFAINGPRTARSNTNIPNPVRTDSNLRIAGNLIWNGSGSIGIGVEASDQGCQPSNATCNLTQLGTDNLINVFEPQLRNPGMGDFRPVASGNVTEVEAAAAPDFSGGDREAHPLAPEGILANAVAHDHGGAARASRIAGAYAAADSPLEPGISRDGGGNDARPVILSGSCTPKRIVRDRALSCTARVSDDRGVASVQVRFTSRFRKALALSRGVYRVRISTRGLRAGTFRPLLISRDTGGNEARRRLSAIRVR